MRAATLYTTLSSNQPLRLLLLLCAVALLTLTAPPARACSPPFPPSVTPYRAARAHYVFTARVVGYVADSTNRAATAAPAPAEPAWGVRLEVLEPFFTPVRQSHYVLFPLAGLGGECEPLYASRADAAARFPEGDTLRVLAMENRAWRPPYVRLPEALGVALQSVPWEPSEVRVSARTPLLPVGPYDTSGLAAARRHVSAPGVFARLALEFRADLARLDAPRPLDERLATLEKLRHYAYPSDPPLAALEAAHACGFARLVALHTATPDARAALDGRLAAAGLAPVPPLDGCPER